MTVLQGAKWVGGMLAAGLVLLLVSIFVADRQLDPPFDEAELGPIDVPKGDPLESGAILFVSDATSNLEIYARPSDGSTPYALTNDATYDSWRPRLSPNRQTVLFYRSPAGVRDTDPTHASLWMMSAQGSAAVEVLPPTAHGWTSQGGAEWSPAGDELVMMGGRPQGIQLWVTSVDGRDMRNLVNAPGDSTDPSWSPDGERVLYVACPQDPCGTQDREVFAALALDGEERVQITIDEFPDEQPRFSPDGRQIVFRTQVVAPDEEGIGAIWDLRVVPTNRSRPPLRLIRDASVSESPVWIDNQTVIFHRIEVGGTNADILTARVPDGTLTPILAGPANELFAAP